MQSDIHIDRKSPGHSTNPWWVEYWTVLHWNAVFSASLYSPQYTCVHAHTYTHTHTLRSAFPKLNGTFSARRPQKSCFCHFLVHLPCILESLPWTFVPRESISPSHCPTDTTKGCRLDRSSHFHSQISSLDVSPQKSLLLPTRPPPNRPSAIIPLKWVLHKRFMSEQKLLSLFTILQAL